MSSGGLFTTEVIKCASTSAAVISLEIKEGGGGTLISGMEGRCESIEVGFSHCDGSLFSSAMRTAACAAVAMSSDDA